MPVREYTDQQIIDRLPICDGWRGLPDGILDVWIRSDEDEFNRFDDKVYTFDCKNGVAKFVMVCSGTSNAGAEGLKHYDKYNREGCAILNGNQIVYNSHAHGLHKGKYPAYRQVKAFPYYRDGNKNNKSEEIGPVHNDIIGANCHKAGMFSTEIGGWSVACLVRNRQEQFAMWMSFMDFRPLSVAILNEWTPGEPLIIAHTSAAFPSPLAPVVRDSRTTATPPVESSQSTASATSAVSDVQAASVASTQPPFIPAEVDNLTDVFQGLTDTLDKSGIANPSAKTSAGTWLMVVVKMLLAIGMSVVAFLKNDWIWLVASVLVVGIAAVLYNQSRNRVDGQRAGVPQGTLNKIFESILG